MSWVAAISRLSRVETVFRSTWRSRSWMCRRSSRRWMVIWSAPPISASTAAATGSGYWVRRDWRIVATWSTLTPRRAGMASGIYRRTAPPADVPRRGGALPQRLAELAGDLVGQGPDAPGVGPLHQHPHLVLGAGEADQHPALVAEGPLGAGDGAGHRGELVEGPLLADRDVHQRLGERLEAAGQLGDGLPLAL